MISTTKISLSYGGRQLFKNVNIKFTPGNCYGLIGANGSGKSTFLKILSGEIDINKGEVTIGPGERIALLNQNQFEFDEYEVLRTVIMGHKKLCEIIDAKETYYAKENFTEEDGIKLSELEAEFSEMNGWEADSEAAILLNGLGVSEKFHYKKMKDIDGSDKIRVLLAQAVFGNPDILLLDEPTNHLDLSAINWLENFLYNFENTVIVVSHDRHFLNKVCTHVADIDYGKIQLYVGNYDFWYESSQLALQQSKDANKKTEAKMKDLQEFIERFSANASKSKQATSRKKLMEKLTLEDIRPSSRKYPFVNFKMEREPGNDLLTVKSIFMSSEDGPLLNNIEFQVTKGDKIALIGDDSHAKTMLLRILAEEIEPESGEFKWGVTTTRSYFPVDNSKYFNDCDFSLVEWLRQFSPDPYESFLRGWLGKMLFSGDEALKQVKVLSGGEKVRCMLSKMMLSGANVLLFDEPTNHLDLESITALNNGLINYKGTILFVSHDHQFVQTVANRIIEITPKGIIDRQTTYDEYIENEEIARLRKQMNS